MAYPIIQTTGSQNPLLALLATLAAQGQRQKFLAWQGLGQSLDRGFSEARQNQFAAKQAASQRQFASTEAEKQRAFSSEQQVKAQGFQAAQADLDRQLRREESALGRSLTRDEMNQRAQQFWANYAQQGGQFERGLAAQNARSAAELTARQKESQANREFQAGQTKSGQEFTAGQQDKATRAAEIQDLRQSIMHYGSLRNTALDAGQQAWIDSQVAKANARLKELGAGPQEAMPAAAPTTPPPALPPEGGYTDRPKTLAEAKQRAEAEKAAAIQKNKDMAEGIQKFAPFVPQTEGRPISENAATRSKIASDLSRAVINEGKIVTDLGPSGPDHYAHTPAGRVLRAVALYMNSGLTDDQIMEQLRNAQGLYAVGGGINRADLGKSGLSTEHLKTYMAWLRANYFGQ